LWSRADLATDILSPQLGSLKFTPEVLAKYGNCTIDFYLKKQCEEQVGLWVVSFVF
jgi:hypothetical protein